ncbi:MAG: glucose-6-phosphate dehydrogenase [Chloroflexi bacterium]|nr:glucose-6-phosphate dehydrogenase [Chloroflexota bacterium]
MDKTRLEPYLFVIMGGTGDLMRRKLLPALYRLAIQNQLPDNHQLLAVARSADMDDNGFRSWAHDALTAAGLATEEQISSWCEECLHYQTLGAGTPADYRALANRIVTLEHAHRLPQNRIFYLALPPTAFMPTVEGLGEAGLNHSQGWTRLVVEKPFGRDYNSARELNHFIHRFLDERQVYRIDHYLGKETVQNLLVFRFANPIFESLWNRDRVESVKIMVAEDLGIEGRANYYEQAGAVRDVLQNHLTQLLTLVTMEIPAAFEADAIHTEKMKVLRQLTPVHIENDVVLGQYTEGQINGKEVSGYRQEPGVTSDSQTETFVALRLYIANWRWQGVPFYLSTGKRLHRQLTKISVTFRSAPVSIFMPFESCEIHSNVLEITLQPDEGFDLCFEVKSLGEPITLQTHSLHFRYAEAFGPLPDAYETLLLDIMRGDKTLFIRADVTEASWRIYAPLLEQKPPLYFYPAGSWGPLEAGRINFQNI